MKILLLCIGKLDRRCFLPAAEEYEKRIRRFCDFEVRQLNEGPVPRSEGEIARCLDQEADRLLACIERTDHVIALCIDAKQQTSEAFASSLGALRDSGVQRIVFVIGSSHGLSPRVVARANARLSMSEMTFPHQLARVLFLEQLYRAFTILNGQTYHK